MNQIVPPRFLFQWSFVAERSDQLPRSSGRLLDLPDESQLPSLSDLDQRKNFAVVKLAWNESGFGFSVEVTGRSRRPDCVASEIDLSDGVRLWINTRNNQSVHRATKFCHHFVILPTGGGRKLTDPICRSLPVARAREESVLPNSNLVRIDAKVTANGYWIDAWFPAEVLTGFDPVANSRIGFLYVVHDGELGDQTLAAEGEFPFESDPSLWPTVEFIS